MTERLTFVFEKHPELQGTISFVYLDSKVLSQQNSMWFLFSIKLMSHALMSSIKDLLIRRFWSQRPSCWGSKVLNYDAQKLFCLNIGTYMEAVAYAESFLGGGGGGGGGRKFRHNRETSQTSFAFAKTAWYCFTFFSFLGSEGGHGAVASPLGTLVYGSRLVVFYKLLLQKVIVNTCQLVLNASVLFLSAKIFRAKPLRRYFNPLMPKMSYMKIWIKCHFVWLIMIIKNM